MEVGSPPSVPVEARRATGELALFDATAPCSVRLSNGWVIDGSGRAGYLGDVLLSGERVLGTVDRARSAQARRADAVRCALTVDATDRVIAPGFINMLSWATESLLLDPRALSDITQGVTLEVLGEGRSMGPFYAPQTLKLRRRPGRSATAGRATGYVDVSWKTLGGYFALLETHGVGVNVASYVGATTLREFAVGGANRAASRRELQRMRDLTAEAMRQGALGVGSSLIYAPASFADTDELVALAVEAARYGGGYISHLRSESGSLLAAVRELIEISERSGARAEIYHLKAAGEANWHKLDAVIADIEAARARGLQISANMYPYVAGATGLDAVMPPWVQAGGVDDWVQRLQDPLIRAQVIAQMREPNPSWENLLLDGADRALLLGFKTRGLRRYIGKTLADVARERGVSAEDAAIDLVIADRSRASVAYTLMSESNLRKKLRLPWVSIGSDAAAPAAEGVFLKKSEHPRAYGSFARVLGKFVREEGVLALEDAVHRMTGLPAANLGLVERGLLGAGYFADVVVFDPARIIDTSTFADSHRYARGVEQVFVNGQRVLKDGRPTGALAGQVVRGPGWNGRRDWP